MNGSNNKLVRFDTQTGDWDYKSISEKLSFNDFGSIGIEVHAPIIDSDGDGVPDEEDEYPNDPNRAFKSYYPGENTFGSLAFEDLWPAKGDYDFNDLVLRYQLHNILNANNKVVSIEASFYVKHIGAAFENGFGISFDFPSSKVASVDGCRLTDGYITLNGNNTEEGHNNAFIVVFDNANTQLYETLNITITLTEPISDTEIGAFPYNPFLIIDKNRDYEVHLPDVGPTQLADINIFGSINDDSKPTENRYYKSQNNLPWAIDIPVDFVYPIEKVEIIKGYKKFADWASSGGTVYEDWYLDNDGYRDEQFLDFN